MRIVVFFIALWSVSLISAQELNCQVAVTSNPGLDITTTEKEIFKEIEQAVFDIMNETVWTEDRYQVEERINCNILISITKVNGPESFEANMQVQATRPVFNTTYNTTILDVLDEDVNFTFRRGSKIIFSENAYTNNFASILAFYAYYIIGLDGDSFSLKGGDPYLKKAQNVVILAQASGGSGWKAGQTGKGKKNRFWLIDNALHELFVPLRECYYDYHRKGLDQLYENPEKAKEEIRLALDKLLAVNSARPGSPNVTNFVRGKRDELIGIYQDSERKEVTQVVNTLKRLDPTNSSKYQEMLQ